MSIDAIKERIEQKWDGIPAAKLCFLILDFLASTPPQELRMLTFGTLARAAKREKIDTDVLTAIQILTSSSLAVLDAKALLVDDTDERGVELSDEEFEHAKATGELAHPETGELVEDLHDHLLPFFVPTEKFLAERQSA